MGRIAAWPRWAAPIGGWLAVLTAALQPTIAPAIFNHLIGAEPAALEATPRYLIAGDVTNDGLTDIVVISPESNAVQVFVADPGARSRFASPRSLHVGTRLAGAALGDLDRDRRLDLAVTDTEAHVVWVLLGQGDGTFGHPSAVHLPQSAAPSAVAIGDFHGCASADLAVADSQRDRVYILINDHGTPPRFRLQAEVTVGADPEQIVAADFNGDGRPDFATLNLGASSEKDVSVALSTRAGSGRLEFETAAYAVGVAPRDLLAADFTGDGRPDVALIDQGAAGAVGQIVVLVNQGAGILAAPAVTPVPCPFFTLGAPCKVLTLATGDFDANGTLELVVGFEDPRGHPDPPSDAMEFFGGRADGAFVPGPVYATQKSPVAAIAGMITGSGNVDLAVVDAGTPSLQAFVNTGPRGGYDDGNPCFLDAECLSSHCIDNVCCATQCGAKERCNAPGSEGTCVPLEHMPVPCTFEDRECAGPFCVDGFCCDEACVGGRCNVSGFEGLCIPGVTDGGPCDKDDECTSGFCSPNLVCCREPCIGGYCDTDGVCRALLPNGDDCESDAQCASDVCDEFDLICCTRRCSIDEKCFEGFCVVFDQHPAVRGGGATSSIPTPTPIETPSTPCSCPSGTHAEGADCVANQDSSSCAIGARAGSAMDLFTMTILPVVLCLVRRRRVSA